MTDYLNAVRSGGSSTPNNYEFTTKHRSTSLSSRMPNPSVQRVRANERAPNTCKLLPIFILVRFWLTKCAISNQASVVRIVRAKVRHFYMCGSSIRLSSEKGVMPTNQTAEPYQTGN